ncbi:MAG TPA: GEVED domain-containing protein [Chitinophagales bacterium]|nr:GEVED domain-containing protein [Chitinophagales bacterium]HRG27151.1 GEVED domain-containing protein [Chitinophagales bacterium]HRG86729.1 GEVED domain-containing protein [Chitinophagales bacterium]
MKNLNKLRPSTWIIFICLQIFTLNISAQYCIPQHSFPMLDVIIDGVELGDIMNTGSGVAEENIGYSDYTELSTALIAGSTNTIYLDNKSWQYNYSVWIDFNQNMEFEEAEKLGTIVLTGVQSGSITFSIPADAINGETRMRVRAVHEPFGPWMNSNDPCLPFLQGDTEDYTVLISEGIEHDLSIKKIISPVSAVELTEESITIAITNHTDTDFSDVNVAYSIDGGPEVVETVPDVIPANSDFIYTFSEPANLAGLGCYAITLEVQHPDDGFPLNDNLEANICNLNYVSGTKKWLIHSNIDGGAEALSGAPYFNTTNTTCMNTVFGEGNWTQEYFETVDPEILFSDSSCFIFLDGSYNHIVAMELFLNDNRQLMENWVAAGGKLYLNSSGSESEGEHFYVDYGFDGTKIAMSYQVTDIKKKTGITHPVYEGPYTPVGTTFSGFYASNAVIYGKNYDTLAHENIDGVLFGAPHNDIPCMIEKQWGIGKVIMSAWAPSQLIDPADKNMNLRQNILVYLGDCNVVIPDDAGVINLPELVSSCNKSETEEIKITIQNYGGTTISAFPVAYKINGGPEIMEIADVSIAPGFEAEYTFATTADLSVPGEYVFEIYTLLPDDIDISNDTFTLSINAYASPIAMLPENITACDAVILDAGNPGTEYVWNTGEITQTITVTSSGTYSVSISDPVSGCEISDTVNVTLEFAPEASFNYTSSGLTVFFENTSSGTGTYFWVFGDGDGSTEIDPTHTYATEGNYSVTLIVENDCGISEYNMLITIQVTPISNTDIRSINLFPNPADEFFIVELENLSGNEIVLEMYDLQGKQIISPFETQIINENALNVNISVLPTGIYVVKLIVGKTVYLGRVEKLR